MMYQNQTIPQHDNADESSLFLTDVAASPSSLSLGQEEAMAAKKQKHARIFCVAGSLLLVAAGRYSAGAATATCHCHCYWECWFQQYRLGRLRAEGGWW